MNTLTALSRTLQLVEAALNQPPVPPAPEHAQQTHRLLEHITKLTEDNRGLRELLMRHQEEIAALNVYASVLEDQLEDYQREVPRGVEPT